MALNCDLNKRIFTFEGKDYSYDEFRALMYDGLLERIPELTAETKETLATEEGKAKVEQGLSLDEVRRRLMEMREEREEGDKLKGLRKTLIDAVGRMTEERAKKMARLIAPKLTIVRHSTAESLRAAHPQKKNVNGFYDQAKKVIHVGPNGNVTHVIAHEVLHPIFDAFIGADEAKAARLYDELVKDERLAIFARFGQSYLNKKDPSDTLSIQTSKEEAIVDFLGAVADGKYDKELLGDNKFMQGIKEMLYRIMEFFGAKRPVVDITDVQTLKDLAKAIAIASRYGKAVKYTERDIDIEGVSEMRADEERWMLGDPKSKLTPKEKEWYDWAIEGAKDALLDESFLQDNPDALTVQGQIDDMLYRLEEQAESVAETDAPTDQALAARIRSARSLVEKLRAEGYFNSSYHSRVSEMRSDEAFNGIEEPKTPIGDTKTVMVDGKERTVLNSNRKPIHPTVEGVRNFWRWFGDSKVVDAEGRPLVVYHGTPNGGFSVFKVAMAGKTHDSGWIGRGIYMTTDQRAAYGYANMKRGESPQIYELYAKLENPLEWGEKDYGAYGLVMFGKELPHGLGDVVYEKLAYRFDPKEKMSSAAEKMLVDQISRVIRAELIRRNHDGVITTYPDGGYEAMVLESSQVKSATGNHGRFDPSREDISEMRADEDFSRKKSSKTHVGTIPIKTYQSVISELDDAIANISDDDFSKMTKRQQVARVIEAASKIMEGTRWFKGRDASERKEAMQSLSDDISQKLGFEPAPKEQMQRVKMREEVRDLKKQVSEAVKSAVRAAISGRKAGFEEGLTAQREKSQRELEAKMSKAEREKERLAQKRVMQGYAQGIAEGRLGGEIYGTRRGRAQGRREEQQKMSQDRVVFLEYLKDIFIDPTTGKTVLKGDQYRQAAAIGRAAARVNPSNPLSVARFKKYAENVIKKAEYEKDLKDARAAKNKAKDMAKGAPQNHKDALQEISSIDVSMIEDPAKYAERVNDYLNVMRSVTSEKYESKSSDEMMDYAESLSLQVEAEYSKLLREEYELSDIGGMSAKQIYDALQSGQFDSGTTNLNSSKREEVKKRVTNLAKYADMSLAEWVKEYDLMGAIGAGAEFTPKEENIFRSLLNPEFEYMSFKQMMEYVKVVDNIITNDSFSGSGKIAEAARASKRAKKLASSISPSTVKAIEGVAMNTMSIADLNVYFFGRGLLNAKIQRAIGIGDYVNANKKHSDMMKAIGKQVVDFYNALNKKDQNAFSDAAVNAEAVVAYAIQHMPGMSDADGLEVRKQILLENIERLRGRNKKEYTDKANHQQIAFDAILKDATSRKQVLENLKRIYPGAHESIEFLINITKPYKDMVRENLNVMWNEASPNDSVGTWDDPYYIPIAYQRIAPSRDIDIDEGSPRAIQDMGQTAPSATKSRLVYKMLPKDKIIDLNPRSVTINRLNSNLYDAVVGDSLVYISQFMRARGIDENVFGNSDNLNYYYTSIKKWIAKYQEINNKDFVSGFLNRNVNFVRDVVVSTKLGTLNQVVKQVPEALTQVMVMTGSSDAFVNLFSGEFMDANANALMSKYAVGERGATVAGTNWEGALSKTYKEIEAATMAKNPNLVKVSAKRLQELTTKPLSLSDASVAKAAWMAYYKYARRAQGYEVNSWETENANHDSDELRKEAALFAETMIDYTMVSSDPKKAASISQKTNEGWKNLAKSTILLFSGFAVQSFSRLRLDLSTLHNYRNMKNAGNPMADKSEAGRALRSITARTVGAGAFWTTSVYVAPLLAEFFAYVVSELLSMDDEDDDDGQTIAALVAVTTIMQSMGLLWGDVAKGFSMASEKIEERDKKKFNQDVIREINVSGDIAKIYMDSIKKNELKKIEQKQLDKINRIKVGFLSSLVGIDVQPNLNAAIIDAINYIDYTVEKINGNKSVINRGKTKPFTEWIKDQENPAFYRYEYKRGETFIDEPISGALEIFLNLPQDADRIIQKAFNRAEKQQNRKNVMNVLKKMKSGELDRLSQDGSTTYIGESSTYQSESQ